MCVMPKDETGEEMMMEILLLLVASVSLALAVDLMRDRDWHRERAMRRRSR